MAERLWDANEEMILNLFHQYPSYELVIVGHSLGAGTASLLNMLCHYNPTLIEHRHKIKCVVFACPPVYTPISSSSIQTSSVSLSSSELDGYRHRTNENSERAMASCINFIHENDCVPFLSVDSVRHLCYSIKVIEDMNLRWNQRIRIITQYEKPDIDVISSIQRTNAMRLQPLPGAPVLIIPASVNVWMKEKTNAVPENAKEEEEHDDDDDPVMSQYHSILCDSIKLAKLGIYLDLNMFVDHMPARYEYALVQHESCPPKNGIY
jgi:Lipase (class 3)